MQGQEGGPKGKEDRGGAVSVDQELALVVKRPSCCLPDPGPGPLCLLPEARPKSRTSEMELFTTWAVSCAVPFTQFLVGLCARLSQSRDQSLPLPPTLLVCYTPSACRDPRRGASVGVIGACIGLQAGLLGAGWGFPGLFLGVGLALKAF